MTGRWMHLTMLAAVFLQVSAATVVRAQALSTAETAPQRSPKLSVELLKDFDNPFVVATYKARTSDERLNFMSDEFYYALSFQLRGNDNMLNGMLGRGAGNTGAEILIKDSLRPFLLYELALADDTFTTGGSSKELDALMARKITALIAQQQVIERTPPVTDEDVQRYYQEHLADFATPFWFKIQNIFLMTYVPYTAAEGDTAQSIAETICRDAAMAHSLRSAQNPLLLRGPEPPEGNQPGDQRDSTPIHSGEQLLAPMPREQADAVYKRMLEILAELEGGADFTELANKYSESESKGDVIGPLPQGNRKMITEIYETAQRLPKGGVSGIIATKHGYQILKVVDKDGPSTRPLESVQEQIRQKLAAENSARRLDEFWEERLAGLEQRIDRQALMQEGAADDQAILTLGDQNYTWGSLRQDALKSGVPALAEARIEIIKHSPVVRQAVLDEYIRNGNFEQQPVIRAYKEIMRKILQGGRYQEHWIDQHLEINDQLLQEYYEQNREMFSAPVQYELYEIIRSADSILSDEELERRLEQYKTELAELAGGIKTLDQFRELAEKISDDPNAKSNQGGRGLVRKDYRGSDFSRNFTNVAAGKPCGPFTDDNQVVLFWIERIIEPERAPFETVRDKVADDYTLRTRARLMNQLRDECQRDLNLEYKFQERL